MRRILIASPVKDSFPVSYHKAIIELLFAPPPPDCTIDLMYCQSGGIHFARDQIATYALQYNFDELIFWDTDLIPNVAMFHRLISHASPDIVCGFYARKSLPTHFNVQRIPGNTPDPATGLEIVSRCAIGFSKIKTSVFRKIIADTPHRAYTLTNEGEEPAKHHQLFPSEIVNGDYFGEDYGFLHLATASGFPIHLDTSLLIPHRGSIDYPILNPTVHALASESWRSQDTPPPFSAIKDPSAPLWPASYLSPTLSPDHCRDVLEGAYDIPYNPSTPPTILDIGANIGAFSLWASLRWPGCSITAYEPHPDNFALLSSTKSNHSSLQPLDSLRIYNIAVSDHDATSSPLRNNGLNCGEFSLYSPPESLLPSVSVPVIDAVRLPTADILKIDTEGAELSILSRLHATGRLSDFRAIVLEFHSDSHRSAITQLLTSSGFFLLSQQIHATHHGVLKFLLHAK